MESAHDIASHYVLHRKQIKSLKPVVDDHIRSVYLPKHSVFNSRKLMKKRLKEQDIHERNEHMLTRLQHSKFTINPIPLFTSDDESLKRSIQAAKSSRRRLQIIRIQKQNEKLMGQLQRTGTAYSNSSTQIWFKKQQTLRQKLHTDRTQNLLKDVPTDLLPKMSLKLQSIAEDSSCNSLQQNSLSSLPSLSSSSVSSFPSSSISLTPSSSASISFLNEALQKIKVSAQMRGATPFLHNHTNRKVNTALIPLSPLPSSVNNSSSFSSSSPYHSPRPVVRCRSPLQPLPSSSSTIGAQFSKLKAAVSAVSAVNHHSLHRRGGSCHLNRSSLRNNRYFNASHNSISQLSHALSKDFISLARRTFSVPFDGYNCVVEVIIRRYSRYTEELGILLHNSLFSSATPKITFYSVTEIDKALQSSPLQDRLVDKHAIRLILLNLFRANDEEHTERLSFSLLKELMMQTELGLFFNAQVEAVLRHAIVEEGEGSLVHYPSFLLPAGHYIQTALIRQQEFSLSHPNISPEEISTLAATLLTPADIQKTTRKLIDALRIHDVEGTGSVASSILTTTMQSFLAASLTRYETDLLFLSLPIDPSGRRQYSSFAEVLTNIRTGAYANLILQVSSANDLEVYLLSLCQAIEEERKEEHENVPAVGIKGRIPFHRLLRLFMQWERFTLPKVAVIHLFKDIPVEIYDTAMVDYRALVPSLGTLQCSLS